MSRIVFGLMAIAGTVHIVFFAGPQMTGASPLVVMAFGALVAAVSLAVERHDHKRRQRKAELQRRRPASSRAGGALSESDEGRARVA